MNAQYSVEGQHKALKVPVAFLKGIANRDVGIHPTCLLSAICLYALDGSKVFINNSELAATDLQDCRTLAIL